MDIVFLENAKAENNFFDLVEISVRDNQKVSNLLKLIVYRQVKKSSLCLHQPHSGQKAY